MNATHANDNDSAFKMRTRWCVVKGRTRPATTYSPNAEMGVSTIGPGRLNCRVRNGNGCIPAGNITGLIRPSTLY